MAAPVTFLYDFEHVDERARRFIMHEFAVNGAKHLVLSDTLISQILQNDNLRQDINNDLKAEGLSFVDAHIPFGPQLDLNSPYEPDRKILVARFKTVLEILAYFGVDTITAHVGNNHWMPPEEKALDKNIAHIEEALAEILPTAERLGITLCIENIWFQTNTPEVLLDLKKHFPTEALGFCYDAGHANLMSSHGKIHAESNALNAWGAVGIPKSQIPWDDQILEKMLPHVVNCHLHDNTGMRDNHDLPGKGNINWPHIVALLNQAPRLKAIQSEVIPNANFTSIRDLCAKFQELFPENFLL